ncbi:MAG: 23S rRNA pseudouridine2605 synthase [Candidatus Woesearchaeota archaeon]|jgi:23S rRNA pseudouridine2605 synthase
MVSKQSRQEEVTNQEDSSNNLKLERVQKLLASAGIASRRQSEVIIEEGRVTVNGKTITIGDKATAKDVVCVDGKPIVIQDKLYIMLNKPPGTITTVSDMYDRETVLDVLPEALIGQRIYPIGRLDRDADGLLLLTNDGEFANSIMHPRYEIKKKYRVWLDEPFTQDSLPKQMTLEDGAVRIDAYKLIDEKILEITLHEGRHKIVKRIFKSMGYRVKRLQRVSIGGLELGNLKTGAYRELSKQKRDSIFS